MTWEHYAKRQEQHFHEPERDENGVPTGPGLEELVARHNQLQGLDADDHTQYLKEKSSGGLASEVPTHNHTSAAEAGLINTTDHGALSGLSDDDHPQYLLTTAAATTSEIADVAEAESAGVSATYARGDHVHRSNKLLSDLETHERMLITAHHGDINLTDGYPEDTLEAFRQAVIKGVNRVDLDTRLSSDGVWHILHDSTVDRTTDGTGLISGKTAAQIAALTIDGGYGYVSARHASLSLDIPTLEDVINALKPYDVTFQLDNKVSASAASLAQFCVDNEIVHRVIITATSSDATAIHAIDPRIATLGVPGAMDAYADWYQAVYDEYDPDDVLASAPKPFSTWIPIEDWGTVDEGAILESAFNDGIRNITVNDIDAALDARASLYGTAEASSGSGPVFIPMGSQASSGQEYDNSAGGSEAFTQFGFVTRLFDPTAYTYDPERIVFEVVLETADSGEKAKARLYDTTSATVVSGSTVQTTSEDPVRLRSGYLTLAEAEHEYRVEVGAVAGGVATCYDAGIWIGNNALSEGEDGETAPPPAPSGLMEDVVNEIRNYPSIEGADDAQPEWWEEADANATLTEVDLAGEGITEKYERALKVVVASANSYAYQLFTYADEPRLKSGKTYSVAVDVWSVSSVSARVRLQSSAGSLGASSDTTAAAWTRLEVEGVALNGTTVQLRLEVDVGTAYFVPLGLVEGSEAPTTQLRPRSLRYRYATSRPTIENLNGSTGKAVADLDLTANTSPLAVRAHCHVWGFDAASGEEWYYYTRQNGSSSTDKETNIRLGLTATSTHNVGWFTEILDDSQIMETALIRQTGSGTCSALEVVLEGWDEWE